MGFLVHSLLGHDCTSLTCAYSFPGPVGNDDSADHTRIRVQVAPSDTNPLRMLRCSQSPGS